MSESTPSVLLIDDEERVLRSLAMLLRGRYKLHGTVDPATALNIVERERINVIVSDQRMPLMRGADLLRAVRERSPNTMRILLTGYSELDSVVASVNEGEIFRFVQKPWNANELRDTVAQAAAISSSLFAAGDSPATAPATDLTEAILVIDDDASVAETVSELVAGSHPVLWARSGEEALEQMEQHEVGLLISELHVGGQNLTPLLKVLKAKHPEVVTMVLTPFQDVGTFIGLINQGQIFRLLPKPVRRGTMQMCIASGIKHYRQLCQAPARVAAHAVAPMEHDEAGSVATRMMGMLSRLRRRSRLA